jgi:hypothetical protein
VWENIYFRHPPSSPKQATMVKRFLVVATLVFLSGTFTSALAQSTKQGKTANSKSNVKFLEDITIDPATAPAAIEPQFTRGIVAKPEPTFASIRETPLAESAVPLEKAKTLQFKYSLLLDIEVELVNYSLFKVIDEWYGVRYRMGGSSKAGIDCSALMQVFFTALYGVALPRTAREQYKAARMISRTEIREGDLVFFNTRGGISHVGMYLSNNKFVHASTNGVAISSLYDGYYASKLIGVGRIEGTQPASSLFLSPKP